MRRRLLIVASLSGVGLAVAAGACVDLEGAPLRSTPLVIGNDSLTASLRERQLTIELPLPEATLALSLETETIGRGERLLEGSVQARLEGEHRLSLERPGVEERLELRGEELWQSWSFAERPVGDGDLVVRIRVAGLAYAGTIDGGRGHRFADGEGRAIVYGAATWIDAAGVATPVESIYQGEHITLRVEGAVVDRSRFPAILDPVIGAESSLEAPVAGPSGFHEESPDVALGPSSWLVVWADHRNGRATDIYGARVALDGSVLDSRGIKIAVADGTQANPRVAAIGGRWLVVWSDDRDGQADIYGAFVEANGDAGPEFPIAQSTAAETNPAIAGEGDEALVAWSMGGDIFGAAVSSSGAVSNRLAIANTAAAENFPEVARAPGGNYLVVWDAAGLTIHGARVTPGGDVLDTPPLALSIGPGRRSRPAVASSGAGFVVSFMLQFRVYELQAMRVTADGAILDETAGVGGVTFSPTLDPARSGFARPACDAAGCVIAFQRGPPRDEDILGVRFAHGSAPGGASRVLSGAKWGQTVPRIASASGGGYLLVWQDKRSGGTTDIVAARMTSSGEAVDPTGIVVSTGISLQQQPALVSDNNGFLAIWSDTGGTPGAQIRARRVKPVGDPGSEPTLVISNTTASAITPATGANPIAGQTLIAWSDTRADIDGDIFARTAPMVGEAMGPELALASAPGQQLLPAVAAAADRWLIVWQDRRTASFDIRGSIVSAGSALVEADFVISAAPGDQVAPTAAFDPSSGAFLVVWMDGRDGADRNLYGSRVSTTGVVLDPAGVLISGAPGLQEHPRLAAGEGVIVATWADQRGASRDIYATRIRLGAALTVLDPAGIIICDASGQQRQPRVDHNPSGFTIAWQDFRGDPLRADLFYATLQASGALEGRNGLLLSGLPPNEGSVALATRPPQSGKGLVAYIRRHDDLETELIQLRTFRP
jgi:hypothetical protein